MIIPKSLKALGKLIEMNPGERENRGGGRERERGGLGAGSTSTITTTFGGRKQKERRKKKKERLARLHGRNSEMEYIPSPGYNCPV